MRPNLPNLTNPRLARRLAPALVATLALAAASAGAAMTKTFRQTSAKDFEEGEATASLILPDGAVVPGMKPSPIAVDAAFVWCGALSPDGRTASSPGPSPRTRAAPRLRNGQRIAHSPAHPRAGSSPVSSASRSTSPCR